MEKILFIMAWVFIIVGVFIWFQKHFIKLINDILKFLFENKDKYNKIIGAVYFLIGLVLLGGIKNQENSIEAEIGAGSIVIILLMSIFLIILHNIILRKFRKQVTASPINNFTPDMPLVQKIQYYIETKRSKSSIFHIGYFILLGSICALIILYFSLVTTNKVIFDIQFTVLIIALITILLAVKQLLLTDNNKADNWLPILYEIEKRTGENLLGEELNKTFEFEKSMEKKAVYNFIIGLLVAVILFVIVVLYFK